MIDNRSERGLGLREYRGRFAPSPTGPLHAGSLFAALASFLDARSHQGSWLVRIEDLDPPREQPGADRLILETLERHGLHSDGDVLYQSTRHRSYQQAIERLLKENHAYYCTCSRRELRARAGRHLSDCPRSPEPPCGRPAAVRARLLGHSPIRFMDRIQGQQQFSFESPDDDFILLRKDGLFAYQLAVVLDDHLQGISDVVRGVDLLDSTPRQIWLQQRLELAPVNYSHFPVLVDEQGNKLSKQQRAPAVINETALANIQSCLGQMGLDTIPGELGLTELLEWAVERWPGVRLHGAKTLGPGVRRDQGRLG